MGRGPVVVVVPMGFGGCSGGWGCGGVECGGCSGGRVVRSGVEWGGVGVVEDDGVRGPRGPPGPH